MKRLTIWVCALLLLALAACGGQGAAQDEGMQVSGAWARVGNAGGNSAVYLKIDNPGQNADTLLNAASEAAESVELHRSEMKDDGTMSMQHQESIEIPARGQVSFEPGGLHVMLINLRQDLKVGDTIQVRLQFQNAGEQQIEAEVKNP